MNQPTGAVLNGSDLAGPAVAMSFYLRALQSMTTTLQQSIAASSGMLLFATGRVPFPGAMLFSIDACPSCDT
jgi:hypothetical protein